MPRRWALITGEYPPTRGGVADYTAQLARGLAAAGDEVHVFAPAPVEMSDGIAAHALPGRYGRRARHRMDAGPASDPGLQWIVQYVPHAYGLRAMNVGFSRWVGRQRARRPWVMFHEVAVAAAPGDTWRRRWFAGVTEGMARRLQLAAGRSFVSIPAWTERLRAITPQGPAPEWLPVPSNLPTEVAGGAAERVRSALRAAGPVVGAFGRFDDLARTHLGAVLETMLRARADLHVWLAGPGSARAKATAALPPALDARLHALGYLPADDTAAHIAASDLVVQIYGDGISSRRGSAMAALALGVPLLSHLGHHSEAFWEPSGAVALAPVEQLGGAALALLDDAGRRRRIGEAGRALYRERFALSHTIAKLREGPA